MIDLLFQLLGLFVIVDSFVFDELVLGLVLLKLRFE